MRDAAVNSLLALAVLGEAVCCVGLLVARTALDKLHYAGAATTIPALLIAAAVVVEEGGTQPALNAIVVAALVLVLGAALNHYTAHVATARRGTRRQ